MPFAGTAAEAHAAVSSLLRLELREGDELIVADNSGTVPATAGVTVVPAGGERSPAHARNVGAEHAGGDFILFLDADCIPGERLLDVYFATPLSTSIGALAGGVVAAAGGRTLAARYGAARSFLSQEAHLAHPYRPRAVAANLMVRRSAFEQLGGFYEGLRAAEDTDFSWRLQEAGWLLQGRPEARVEHRYRATVADLRRQWRGYAAGRAWLARRYQGFEPEPALVRASRRIWACRRGAARGAHAPGAGDAPAPRARATARGAYLALDGLLAVEELAGFTLSNRPRLSPPFAAATAGILVVLVADRFPAPRDPLAEFARTLDGARVEAAARPGTVSRDAAREVRIDYREDDGVAARAGALARLVLRHPVRCALDVLRRRRGEPALAALAPAVQRLARDADARVQALGGEDAEAAARRLAALSGSSLEPSRSS
jgi:GT2 family glycosyltransferase